MSNKSDVLNASAWYTVSNFLLKGIGFITTPIFARLLTKSEYGGFSNYCTWLSLLLIIVTFSMSVSINRARFDFKDKIDEYVSSVLILGTIITAAFYIVVVFNMTYFERVLSMDSFYIHTLFIYALVQPALEVFQSLQRVTYKYKMSVFLSLLSTLGTTILSIALVVIMRDKLYARVIGYILPLIIINVVIYLVLTMRGKAFKWEYCKYALSFSWPFIPHLLSASLLSSSDRIMITNMVGSESTAIYTLACSCMTIVTILWTSMNNAVSPWVFDQLADKRYRSIYKITIPYLLVFTIPVVFIILVGPEILWILGGSAYAEANSLIIPLMISVIVQFVYSLYVNIEQFSKKTWAIAIGTPIAAGINVLLNYFLIPKFGYHIAAYTTLIGYCVLLIVHYTFVRICGYKNIYNDKAAFLLVIACIMVQPVLLLLYEHTIIRYCVATVLLVALIIFAIKNKGRIYAFLKSR